MVQRFKIFSQLTLMALGALGLVTLSFNAHAETTGLGIILGEPTGLTAKHRLSATRAVQAGLAWSFDNYTMLYGDYLFHFPGALGSRDKFVTRLSPYLGIGGTMLFGSNVRPKTSSKASFGLGVRFPIGLEWSPSDPPLGVFLELAPGLGLVPGTFGFLQGGVGVRYYF
jgi:hypothetical protein